MGDLPLDADVERPYLSADGRSVVFSSRATNLGLPTAGGLRQVYAYSLAARAFSRVGTTEMPLADGDSEANAVSADGRYILLTSTSTHWASGDENGSSDVFLFDGVAGEVTLVSRSASGRSAQGASLGRDLSPDGRFAVYSSAASDLTLGDDNDAWDVFVWDRLTGTTERVSMGPGDQQANPVPGNHAHISADGRFVSFHSQSQALVGEASSRSFDVFLFDRELGSIAQVSRAWSGGETDGNTFVLGMSDDARFFAAYASATNLVSADTNGESDAFLLDHQLGTTVRANLGQMGEEPETGTTNVSLSHDGALLSFASASPRSSAAQDGVHLQTYVYDRVSGHLTLLSQNGLGEPGNDESSPAEFSASGRCFVFASRAANLTVGSSDDGTRDLFVGRFSAAR